MYVLLATAMPSRVVFAGFDDDVETILFLEVFVTKLRNCLITSPCFPPFAPQNILLRCYSEVFFCEDLVFTTVRKYRCPSSIHL